MLIGGRRNSQSENRKRTPLTLNEGGVFYLGETVSLRGWPFLPSFSSLPAVGRSLSIADIQIRFTISATQTDPLSSAVYHHGPADATRWPILLVWMHFGNVVNAPAVGRGECGAGFLKRYSPRVVIATVYIGQHNPQCSLQFPHPLLRGLQIGGELADALVEMENLLFIR